MHKPGFLFPKYLRGEAPEGRRGADSPLFASGLARRLLKLN
ncbi:hypothetical protein shim_00140 [Shimia sp. SK013]|nr:hypothetical protein shim_00140 [Shimia sp. SK013]